MAKRAKLSNPVAIRWANVVNAGKVSMLTSMVKMPEIPMLNAIGTPMDKRIIKLTTSTKTPI
jgi:hypothetical protein